MQRNNNILSINRQILALAIPSIVANITTPLLALVDTAIVGHMGSAVFIASIAVGGTVFNMIYWLFGFLRMGSSGPTAQEWGRGNMEGARNVLCRSLLIAVVGGLTLILFSRVILAVALRFMDTDSATSMLVGQYFDILIFGAPSVLANYSLTGWFLGMQDSRTPMWISLFINVVNIAVSLILVIGLGWGIKGVAAGTLAAQWGGCLLGLAMTRRYGVDLFRSHIHDILNRHEFRRFFSINFDIFLRTLCLIAVTVWFTRTGSRQGTTMLAVNTLLMQFFILFSYMMDGFAFAGEALAGRYTGEGDGMKLHSVVLALLKWGVSISLLFTVVYGLCGDSLLRLLCDNGEVIEKARDFKLWTLTIPIAGFAAFTWDGVFIGTTMTRSMLLSMALATVVFFIGLGVFYPSLGNDGLWLSFVLYLAVRGGVLTLVYFRRRHSRAG